jgi:hypothetical protein
MSFNKPFRAVPIRMGTVYRAKLRREKGRRVALPVLTLGAVAADF